MKKLLTILLCTLGVLALAVNVCACSKDTGINSVSELEQAFSKSGSYILKSDIESEVGFTVKENVKVKLNLNGKSIVCSNDGPSITNKGKLTLFNGRVYSTDIQAQGRIAVKNEGDFYGDNLYLGSKSSRGNAIRNFKTAHLKNSVIDCCDNYINGNGYAYAATNSEGKFIIENCTYNGSANGVFGCDGGEMIIKGGSYILDGLMPYYIFYMGEEGKITVNNGTFIKSNAGTRKLAYSEAENLDKLYIEGGVIILNDSVWTKPEE